MKKIILVLMALLATMAVAQQTVQAPPPYVTQTTTVVTERPQPPSYSDLYCSGFITNENFSLQDTVAGGINSPNETLFATGNTVYLAGKNYQEGAQYTILRPLKDPNHYEPFPGQRKNVAALGQPYAEIGRVKVKALRGAMAVADVEFSCQQLTIGDIAVPFKEHPPVAYRKITSIEQFPQSPARVSARIVMAREFDYEVGTGQKVYIDAGSNKGVKVGDYFRVVRGYDQDKIDTVDATAYKAPVGDDTQKVPGKITKEVSKLLPVHTLGEAIVLNVTPTSSTVMITNAFQSIQVGDEVQLENEQ